MNAEIIPVLKIKPAVLPAVLNGGNTVIKGRFQPGNPGRPKGSRNKRSMEGEQYLVSRNLEHARKADELAMKGNVTALELCMARSIPIRKSPLVELPDMPDIADAASALEASKVVLRQFWQGKIDADQVEAGMRTITLQIRFLNQVMDEDRLRALEEKIAQLRVHSP